MAHVNALGQAVWLPRPVEELLRRICDEQSLFPPDSGARRALAGLGEAAALDVLMQMAGTRIRNFSGFILHMVNNFRPVPTQESVALSSGSSCSFHGRDVCSDESLQCNSRYLGPLSSGQSISPQLVALGQLEFRKAFLILSYLGRYKLEETISVEFIKKIQWLNMDQFEADVWKEFGSKCIPPLDRRKSLDWDSRKAHIYHCHVDLEGNVIFKGPYLQLQRTHMQRVLGDDNVLLVKFTEEMNVGKRSPSFQECDSIYHKVAQEGILVGLRRYQFFVYKDGGKEEKKKCSTSSPVKCYFVRMESNWIADQEKPYILSDKFIHESRAVFMHVHKVSSLSKYMARFSLILSKTMKLDIDVDSIHVEPIEDIPCMDDDGNISYDENGEPLIHTDGTGFISEDLALKCPRHISKGKCWTPMSNQFLDGSEIPEEPLNITKSLASEVPLLIQIRLFNKGKAFKGTLLLNKLLPPRTIQVRRSMRKVDSDANFSYIQSCNSLEIVATSNRPKRTCLSRYLIALLHYGGVPNEYFLELLKNALDDAQNARYTKVAAIKVSLKYGDMDDFLVSRMILCGIPLDEPYMQFRLSVLMKEERKGLKAGKLPVTDCYYLMGTADPTGLLKPNEVCVVLENGQISGDVLVYKHPGLHFGDIHVLSARYIKELESFVGDSKYAIFFPTKGPRSLAHEMANSDFDGDMYWVSRNSQLLRYFRSRKPWVPMSSTGIVQQKRPLDLTDRELEKQLFLLRYFRSSKPWVQMSSTGIVQQKSPLDFTDRELEKQLFDQFLANRFKPSYTISVAADCWLSYMDRLLTLSDDCVEEKECLKEKILKLVDIYYDAVDAPKSGLKIDVPPELKAEKYPHYMEKPNSTYYTSTSVLGLLFDKAGSLQTEDGQFDGISKLPCYNSCSESCLSLWKPRYNNYLSEMSQVLRHEIDESKEVMANDVIKKYKWMLYEAAEFEDSPRKRDDIFEEALAIYNIAYDYAQLQQDAGRCSFAWNVAGGALCMLHASKQDDKSWIPCSRSVLAEILR